MERTYFSTTETAKFIRQILKESFSGIKFSVRTNGAAVYVSWSDGPSQSQVTEAVEIFGGTYLDSRNEQPGTRRHTLDNKPVNFAVDYIFCQQESSSGNPVVMQAAHSATRERIAIQAA